VIFLRPINSNAYNNVDEQTKKPGSSSGFEVDEPGASWTSDEDLILAVELN
jgi:hypothetical protein